tara:strand:+ start:151 stop:486 length:336 start_codon:yes stop_codon:yes gene_type:complete
MASLSTKVKKYLEANSKVHADEKNNFLLQNNSDGEGDFIKSWNVSGLAKPTDEQLTSYENVGNTEEALSVILSNRRNAYPSWGDQLDDIYHNGIDGWKATIKVTKDRYPKE